MNQSITEIVIGVVTGATALRKACIRAFIMKKEYQLSQQHTFARRCVAINPHLQCIQYKLQRIILPYI